MEFVLSSFDIKILKGSSSILLFSLSSLVKKALADSFGDISQLCSNNVVKKVIRALFWLA